MFQNIGWLLLVTKKYGAMVFYVIAPGANSLAYDTLNETRML